MSDRMEQAWCKMVADAAWDASSECPIPGSDVIVWAHQQMSALEAKLAAAEADAEIVKVVFQYIDRMNDVCPQDPAEKIIHEFCDAVGPAIDNAIDAARSAK